MFKHSLPTKTGPRLCGFEIIGRTFQRYVGNSRWFTLPGVTNRTGTRVGDVINLKNEDINFGRTLWYSTAAAAGVEPWSNDFDVRILSLDKTPTIANVEIVIQPEDTKDPSSPFVEVTFDGYHIGVYAGFLSVLLKQSYVGNNVQVIDPITYRAIVEWSSGYKVLYPHIILGKLTDEEYEKLEWHK